MKKIMISIACVCSLLFISCASKPEAETLPENMDNLTELLEQENTESDDSSLEAETPASEEDTENTAETEYNAEDGTEEADEELSSDSDALPELEEIEEPVVITLEPEIIPEPEVEVTVPSTEELIEVETPPVIVETEQEAESSSETEQTTAEAVSDNSESAENTETENDSVILVDETQNSDDVIDVTDEASESTKETEPVEKEEIIPSRKVTLKKMEYVDITYPGTGWIYMGLTDGSKDLTYFGRKLGTGDTRFTLQAKNAGTKIVHFYKNDALTNQYIDDYIEVEVLPEKGSNKTHVAAPEYKQPVPAKAKEILQKKTEPKPSAEEPVIEAKVEEVKQVAEEPKTPEKVENQIKVEESILPAVEEKNKSTADINILLKDAEVLYNEKEYKAALDKLNSFFEQATSKLDEALFLKGQVLEAKSPVQDIKGAMEAYNSLTKNYPASKYWEEANKRIKYLKKFYFGG